MFNPKAFPKRQKMFFEIFGHKFFESLLKFKKIKLFSKTNIEKQNFNNV